MWPKFSRPLVLLMALLLVAGLWRSMLSSAALAQGDQTEQAEPPTATDQPTNTPPPTATFTPTSTPQPPAQITDEPTDAPPADLSVSASEPREITAGEERTLSVFGQNFTSATTIRLVGFGLLTTSPINSGALSAALPASIPPGEYAIQVSDPVNGSDDAPGKLRVRRAPGPTDLPSTAKPDPTQTDQPTLVPGQPSLMTRNYSASPSSVAPGGQLVLTFEVINQGNRPALGVSAALDSDGKFVPAGGQSGATLPDLPVGGIVTVTLTVGAAMDAPAGPATVPITFAYSDFEGKPYTSKANLGVTVQEQARSSQVTLARYSIDPNPVVPGEPVRVTVLVTNSGTDVARQVLLRVTGDGSVLLAGPQGDSFPVGDLAPGASASLDLPLVVSSGAKRGPQSQPFTMSYLQKGESKDTAGSLTLNVADVTVPQPLMLLDSYDIGADQLQPGDRFTLHATLKNVGAAGASDLLVTFGTVEQTSDGGTDTTGDSSGGSSSGGSNTSTTPGTTFAPLNAGGTLYIGALAGAGGTATIQQDFIVNGTISSGIYSLPITLRYQTPDGATNQDSLRASVVVVAPPQLQATLTGPLPEQVNVGDPIPLGLEILNVGKNSVRLTRAEVTAQNGDVQDGAETFLVPLAADDSAPITATIFAQAEGAVTMTVTLHFRDDLNQPSTLMFTYETTAVTPPPPETEQPTDEQPPPEPTPSNDDRIGRFLLGFLGLGS